MRLPDYIKMKIAEIDKKGIFRSVRFTSLESCKVSKHATVTDYLTKVVSSAENVEVEEIERSKLDDTEIDAIELVISAVKQGCRKPIRYTYYVKKV